MKKILLTLALLLLPTSGLAQSAAVLVPAPIPTCVDGDVLMWQSSTSTFICTTAAAASQPFVDNLSLMRNSADGTKRLFLNLAAITTETDRTWTVPDANITFPATIASLAANTFTGTQTATAFSGDGALLTALNAAELTGTVPLASLVDITNAQISASASIVYSKLALTGSIVNADVNASAAIAWSKISKTGSSLADLATRSASDLSSGTLPDARLSGAYTGITGLGTLTGLTTSGTFNATGTGPHAIGGATSADAQLMLTGNFTGSGSTYGMRLNSSLTGTPGNVVAGLLVTSGITEAASGTHARLAAVDIRAVTVTGAAATVTDTASLYIAAPMAATVTGANYALWVDAGVSRFDGDISLGVAGTSVLAPRFIASTGTTSASGFAFTSAGFIQASSDGIFVLSNAARDNFSRQAYGGLTSGFPAWKRQGATLEARLADDSAQTAVLADNFRAGTAPATSGAIRLSHAATVQGLNAAGSANRVLMRWGATANNELEFGDEFSPTRIRASLVTPTNLANGDWWVECSGTSPSRVCAIKVRDGGVTRTIGSITF